MVDLDHWRRDRLDHIRRDGRPVAVVQMVATPWAEGVPPSMPDDNWLASQRNFPILLALKQAAWPVEHTNDGVRRAAVEHGRVVSSVQIFDNGAIEATDVALGTNLSCNAGYFESAVLDGVAAYINVASEFGFAFPVTIAVSLLNLTATEVGAGSDAALAQRLCKWKEEGLSGRIQGPEVQLPAVMIKANDTDQIARLMKVAFDRLWRFFGYEESPNYDSCGCWSGQSV